MGPMPGAALAAKPGSALLLGPGTETRTVEDPAGAPCPAEGCVEQPLLDDEAVDCGEDHVGNGSVGD